LAENIYLEQLHDRNETLYFKLLTEHLAELLPVAQDPGRLQSRGDLSDVQVTAV
jgi:hypothetical protein